MWGYANDDDETRGGRLWTVYKVGLERKGANSDFVVEINEDLMLPYRKLRALSNDNTDFNLRWFF